MAMFAASKPNIKTGGWCPNMHGHDSFTADFWFNSSLSTPVRKPLFLCNGHHRFHSEKKSQPQPLCSPIIKHHLGTPSNHFTRQLRKRHCWRSEQKRGVLLTVSGSIALCSTSRGTNRRHRLLGNFSPPAGLQTATDPWTCFDYMQPSVSSAKILLHPVCQLWICVVDEEKWYRELTPMLTTPKSQWSFIQKMSFQPSHLQPCGLQRHLAFVLHCHANAKWNEYKKVIFCYLCWILFSHLGVNSLQHIWNKAKKVTLTYQVFFHLWIIFY